MKGGPQARVSSPVLLRSTLTTSAPRSASTWPAQGPARMRASSRTRTPASGPAMTTPWATINQKHQGTSGVLTRFCPDLGCALLAPLGQSSFLHHFRYDCREIPWEPARNEHVLFRRNA